MQRHSISPNLSIPVSIRCRCGCSNSTKGQNYHQLTASQGIGVRDVQVSSLSSNEARHCMTACKGSKVVGRGEG